MLDLSSVDFIDSQGAAKVGELGRLAESNGIALQLTSVKDPVRAVLEADGRTSPITS